VTQYTIQELQTGHSNTNGGYALGVNNKGEVVGHTWFYPPDAMLWAGYWPNIGALVQGLSSGTGTPRANRINEYGGIAGVVSNRATFWKGGVRTDLGPATSNSEARGLSNQDPPTIVGLLGTLDASDKTPIIFNGTAVTLLHPTNKGAAHACNNKGQVVGEYGTYGRGFIWDQQKGMRDLNTLVGDPDWDLRAAYGINDNGEIVGWGYYKCAYDFAYVLKPVAAPPKLEGPRFLLLSGD
jgi:probable HAF family extracellular repeat protein